MWRWCGTDLATLIPRLAGVNAVLISLSGLAIVLGVRAIRRGERDRHMRYMYTATALAGVFLVLYLIRIAHQGTTPFWGHGLVRWVYYGVLISHLGLAVLNMPLVLATLYRAWRGDFAGHRRVARVAYPIWLYVSVTGVLVYLFLHPPI